ncbi:MAG: hypothetical protein ACE5Q6_07545 [Dehalococcoidia bacterium]
MAVALLLLALAGCGSGDAAAGQEGRLQVRGHILEAVPKNVTELELLRVRDDTGREYSFIAEGFIGFTPSHLKQHQLFGQTVLVTYLERGDELLAVAVAD